MGIPSVTVTAEQTWLDGGLDLISPPGFAKPGTCRFATNYELEFGGGYRRVGGFERFDGRPAPSLAAYVVVQVAEGSLLTLGMTVQAVPSNAEGKVVWISQDLRFVGLTRLLDGFAFEEGDELQVASSTLAVVENPSPSIDPFVDNDIAYAAAEEYRQFIQKPPGQGPVLGVAILNNIVYCWRDLNDSVKRIYKSTSTGWQAIDLGFRVSFENGQTPYLDGQGLTQGSVGAIIRRVVVTEGEWGATDPDNRAKGYFIIDEPVGGNFVAGGATGAGACDLLGPQTPITLAAGGRVSTVVYNFTGDPTKRRLYGCDGNNLEFEFDGTVYVPIETGMGIIRAKHVVAHKNHLFYAFGPSLQHSGIGEPYKWQPLFGAGELALGDEITNMLSVPGSETNAALMVASRNSVHILYGNSAGDWDLKRIADDAGAQPYSGQIMGTPLVFDRDGFSRYSPTDAFGNFGYESASRSIDPLVRNSTVSASVLVKNRSMYRCFFADGSFVTVTPAADGLAFMSCDYGRVIVTAVGGEISNQYRVFMGDSDGWVLEADVGRSFDGETIEAGLRLSSQNQRSVMTEKQYRYAEIQTEASTAFQIAISAEYSDSEATEAQLTEAEMVDFKKQYGAGLFWDFNSWDQAYWDGASANRLRLDIHGLGRSITLLFASSSDRELPHTIKTTTLLFTPRRLGR